MRAAEQATAVLVGAAAPAALAVSGGGYFPEDWGVATLAFLVVAAGVLVLRPAVALRPLDLVPAAALALLAGWQALSAAWGPDGPAALEVERTALYVAVAAAAALLPRGAGAAWLLAGAVLGTWVVAAWAVAARGLPGEVAAPIGYPNAVAVLAALGAVLALGLAAASSDRRARTLLVAATPVFAAALALEDSRGAWLALALGAAVGMAASPRPGRAGLGTAALAMPALVATLAALQAGGLASGDAAGDALRTELVRLGAVLAVLTLAAGALGRLVAPAGWALPAVPRPARLAAAGAVVLVLAGGVLWLAAGGGAGRVADAFRAPLPAGESGSLRTRLVTLSSNNRADYWAVAAGMAERRPVLGTGAGTFRRTWLRERPTASPASDAHSLYLEVLGELGPLGLGLVVVALAAPLVAVVRARGSTLVPGAAGAYAAFLAHAALDWDWELPAVTATALLVGGALLAAGRGGGARPLGLHGRVLGLVLLAPVLVVAAVGHAGNRAAATAAAAVDRADAAAALEASARAVRWAPWSTEAERLRAEALLVAGRPEAARRVLRAALARDEGDWALWYDLAAASEGAARRRALARAAALNPHAPELVSPG